MNWRIGCKGEVQEVNIFVRWGGEGHEKSLSSCSGTALNEAESMSTRKLFSSPLLPETLSGYGCVATAITRIRRRRQNSAVIPKRGEGCG